MFQLDRKSSRSIYEQVIDKFKELIMTDVLPEDTRLPSVRELSRQLTINPNTVQKAYRELEREGYVFTVSGRGTFVAPRSGIQPDPAQIQQAQELIRSGYRQLLYLGRTADQAWEFTCSAIGQAAGGTDRKESSKWSD